MENLLDSILVVVVSLSIMSFVLLWGTWPTLDDKLLYIIRHLGKDTNVQYERVFREGNLRIESTLSVVAVYWKDTPVYVRRPSAAFEAGLVTEVFRKGHWLKQVHQIYRDTENRIQRERFAPIKD